MGDVVKAERPDLESKKAELTTQQNTFKITLKKLEDDLLHRYMIYILFHTNFVNKDNINKILFSKFANYIFISFAYYIEN